MKGKFAQGGGIDLDPGAYEVTLEKVIAWSTQKYQEEGLEPTLTFIWYVGEDEEGEPIILTDTFIRIPRDRDGYPVLTPRSKLFERLSALAGFPVDEEHEWELMLPDDYDDPAGLDALPSLDERNEEGFKPLEVDILVDGESVIGNEAIVTVEKNDKGYLKVTQVSAKPKTRKPKRPARKKRLPDLEDEE